MASNAKTKDSAMRLKSLLPDINFSEKKKTKKYDKEKLEKIYKEARKTSHYVTSS